MLGFLSNIKGWLLAALGIAGAIATGVLYVLLQIARGNASQARQAAKRARQQAVAARARAAAAEAANKVRIGARQAVEQVEQEARQQPPPDTQNYDDFEGTK